VISPPSLQEFDVLIVEVRREAKAAGFKRAEMCQAEPLPKPASADPDDDKFIACALSSGSRLIVSGDKHFFAVDGYLGIEILKPTPGLPWHRLI
jgi:predicted nucleic acid-binding protein